LVTQAAKRALVTQPAAGGVRLTAWLRGRVQGVGMRWWIRSRALELGLTGWARNLDDGRVEVVAEGSGPACRALLARLQPDPMAAGGSGRPGRIEGVVERWSVAAGLSGVAAGDFLER
jgi:acylphosphatase